MKVLNSQVAIIKLHVSESKGEGTNPGQSFIACMHVEGRGKQN